MTEMTDNVPATVFVSGNDGKASKIPATAYNPAIHRPARACPTVEVRDKRARKGSGAYVINAADFDAKQHVRASEATSVQNPDQ
jgi:hypothetical protein|tara:strand:+ start:327 stop:578 length:252 start_codon:yes stop_codon:yes gene_type:complete